MECVITIPAPAKLNLFLAVAGRRTDGFHELVSVVAPLAWGDEVEIGGRRADGREFVLDGGDEEVPGGDDNLAMKAAREFRAATAWGGAVSIRLTKRVPVGAGLGGGSSDAAATLRGLNEAAGRPLGSEALGEVAARVGSDCASLLHDGPVVMRGRGERVEVIATEAAVRLRGRRVLVFKPAFGISTAWSYRRLSTMRAGMPAGGVADAAEAEGRLGKWIRGDGPAEELLFNSLEQPAFEKFPALPMLLERLRREFRVGVAMSGSGSACFALLHEAAPVAVMAARIRDTWGNSSFIVETRLA